MIAVDVPAHVWLGVVDGLPLLMALAHALVLAAVIMAQLPRVWRSQLAEDYGGGGSAQLSSA